MREIRIKNNQAPHPRAQLTLDSPRDRVVMPRMLWQSRRCVLLAVIPMLVLSLDANAQETGLGGGALGGSTPGAPGSGLSTSTAGDDTDASEAASPTEAYGEPSPFGFGAVSYAPGFGGCATQPFGSQSAVGDLAYYQTLEAPPAPADAGRYVQFAVGGSETYTDNLNLDPSGQEESDFITSITPSVNACAQTGRFQGSLTYELQGVIYANNSEYNDVYNNILADTTISLIPGRLFLGADTSYGQAVVDPSISYSRSNIIRPGNKTSVWTTNISPYLFQPLGPIGDATLRYRFGTSIYGNSNVSDSTVNGAYFDLNNPQEREVWSWHLSAFTQRVKRSGGNDPERFFRSVDGNNFAFDQNGNLILIDEDTANQNSSRVTYFDKATLELGYQLTRTLQLLALGGLEDDYQQDGTNDRLGNSLWNVGVRWSSEFNTLEARVGHRFFGTSYYLSATHRGRLLDASLGYSEEPSNQSLESLNSNASGRNPAAAGPVTSLFDRGVFVNKEVTASLGFNTARTTTTLSGYNQRREYVNAGVSDDDYIGADLQIAYQLQPRTQLIPRGGWQRRDSGSGTDSDTYDFGATLARQFTPTAQGAVSYAHTLRNADESGGDYDENRVVVQLLKSF